MTTAYSREIEEVSPQILVNAHSCPDSGVAARWCQNRYVTVRPSGRVMDSSVVSLVMIIPS